MPLGQKKGKVKQIRRGLFLQLLQQVGEQDTVRKQENRIGVLSNRTGSLRGKEEVRTGQRHREQILIIL